MPQGGGYAFEGEFCQAAIKETWSLKHQANLFRNLSDQRAVKRFVYEWGPTAAGMGCIVFTAGTGALVCGSIVALVEVAKASRDIRNVDSQIGAGGAILCLAVQIKTKSKAVGDGCAALVTGMAVGNAISKAEQARAKRPRAKTPQDDR